jgi:antirestriction protein ArdC
MNTYDIITNRIIKQLEAGKIPWRQEWTSSKAPSNFISKKEYNGINRLMLWSSGYTSPFYMTFNQIKGLGGYVNKGEKGIPIVFFKIWNPVKRIYEEGDHIENGIPVIRYYTVFNITQSTIKPPEEVKHEFIPIEEASKIIEGYKDSPQIKHIEQRAYYQPLIDVINLPKPETFSKAEHYYSTAFHEMTHSTGHKSRLNRELTLSTGFGSDSYSNEELIAELGAAFLSADCGINQAVIDNQTAYIGGWIKRLRNDTKLIVQASTKAQKARNYIRGII